jgi:hypothetical protein
MQITCEWSRLEPVPWYKNGGVLQNLECDQQKRENLQNQFFYQQKCEVDPLKWGTWGLLYK